MRPSGSYETRTPGSCRCRSTMRADATRIVGAQPGNAAGEASTGMPGAGSWPGVDMPVKIDASGDAYGMPAGLWAGFRTGAAGHASPLLEWG